mmetsp:Transcript_58062/g.165287  ORF Transcript_58062/g.165287 Transcript_58062/m.165287 type:complete len:204 (-) Transcript_58062:258-869(-)
MLCARPSAMDVFPTPGSPTSTGLFFERRPRMRTVRLSSSSRPMSGSILPSRAIWVRSLLYFSVCVRSTSCTGAAAAGAELLLQRPAGAAAPPLAVAPPALSSRSSAPSSFARVASAPSQLSRRHSSFDPASDSSWARMARSRCEVPTDELPCERAHSMEFSSTLLAALVNGISSALPPLPLPTTSSSIARASWVRTPRLASAR